jgi:hypothetical protein
MRLSSDSTQHDSSQVYRKHFSCRKTISLNESSSTSFSESQYHGKSFARALNIFVAKIEVQQEFPSENCFQLSLSVTSSSPKSIFR